MTIVMALDYGTGGLRGALFDADTGQKLAEDGHPYDTVYPQPGWAEQDPKEWWLATRATVANLRSKTGVERIDAICLSTTASTVVFCDAQNRPIGPAILWMDARASEQSELTAQVDHPIIESCGGSCASEWLVPKAMWLAKHRPDDWRNTKIVCEALDYINFRLTGRWVGSLMNATCKWTYDSRINAYHQEVFDGFGLPELTEKLPPEIISVGSTIEQLSQSTADELDLNADAIVVQGGIDAHIGMFGAGTLEPGEMLLIGGTSTAMLTNVLDDGAEVKGFWGPYPNAAIQGLRLIEAGQVSSGSILNWLTKDIFGLAHDDLAALNDAARKISTSNSGLMALDFWMGNRTPYRDPRLRGALLGLSLGHDRASIYNACVSAIALGGLNVTSTLLSQGVKINRLALAGGIEHNDYWLDATVNAIGVPAELYPGENLTLTGGAVLAATEAGAFASWEKAAKALLPNPKIKYPDQDQNQDYLNMLDQYRRVTSVLAPELHLLADAAGGDT